MGLVIGGRQQQDVSGRDDGNAERARGGQAIGQSGTLLRHSAQPDPQPARTRPGTRRAGGEPAFGGRHAGGEQRSREPRGLDHDLETSRSLAQRGDEVEPGIQRARAEELAQARVAAAVERE